MHHIALLRHGQTTMGNCYRGSLDDALTNKGWTQMETALANPLHNKITWQCVFSSPLQRCFVFAKDYADRMGAPLKVDDRLKELHFGSWEGKTAQELYAKNKDLLTAFWNDPENNTPPEGETLSHLRQRVMQCWQSIYKTAQIKNVLVITHGGPIRILLNEAGRGNKNGIFDMQVSHGELIQLCPSDRANINKSTGKSINITICKAGQAG